MNRATIILCGSILLWDAECMGLLQKLISLKEHREGFVALDDVR
ncbi:hypothetical protein M2263_003755 [Providencia alcalifaciens]|nr:hypothetical protein [Providencia alcalifaciens]